MEELSKEKIDRISQFLSTEHFTLQGARNGTISESNGRLGGFLSAVSMSIVALAFIAQVSDRGGLFLIFSIIVFPVLIFMGIGTLIRLIQLGISDVLLIKAIHRIRHFYLDIAPEAEPYFSFPQYDDDESLRSTVLPVNIAFEGFGSAGFQVAVINSVLFGVFAGILASGVFHLTSNLSIAAGIVGLVLGLGLQVSIAAPHRLDVPQMEEIRFPPESKSDPNGDM